MKQFHKNLPRGTVDKKRCYPYNKFWQIIPEVSCRSSFIF